MCHQADFLQTRRTTSNPHVLILDQQKIRWREGLVRSNGWCLFIPVAVRKPVAVR